MLIDSHCHIPHKKYSGTSKDVVERAKNEGVVKMVSIGTDLKSNQRVAEAASNFDAISHTIGIYPQEHLNLSFEQIKEGFIRQLEELNTAVGIGECGIDITDWENQRPLEQQIPIFELQIEAAIQKNLPLVIHNRNGDEHVLKLLQKYSPQGLIGVAHCFTSTWEIAKQYLDLNFYISFSGIITYPSGKAIHETVEKVPLDKFVIETDAPYLPPQGFRNKVNEPKYVKMVAEKVAEIKNLPLQEIEQHSYRNTCSLFNI